MLQQKSAGVNLEYNMAIFHDEKFPIKKPFGDVLKTAYEVDTIPVDFANPQEAVTKINKHVAGITRQRIPKFVTTGWSRTSVVSFFEHIYCKIQ